MLDFALGLAERDGKVDPTEMDAVLRRCMAHLRRAVERLRRECGPEAAGILASAVDGCEHLIDERFGNDDEPKTGSNTQNGPSAGKEND